MNLIYFCISIFAITGTLSLCAIFVAGVYKGIKRSLDK